MRLVILAVSIYGSFGPDALRFFSALGRRAGDTVPFALLGSATWATPRFAPFVRMAVSHAVRRGLAEAVLRRWRRVSDPSALYAAPPPPPPAPCAFAVPLPGLLPHGLSGPLGSFAPGLLHAPVPVPAAGIATAAAALFGG